MGAVPSQLRGFGNKLKIVNNVKATPSTPDRGVERLELPSDEEGTPDVNLLVSITRDKTVIISEGKTIGTQTDPGDIRGTDAPNDLVLVSENSQAPIETTFRAKSPTAVDTENKDKIDDEPQTVDTSREDELDTYKDNDDPEKGASVKAPDDDTEEETGFLFEPYDANKIGDPINYETSALVRYGKYKVKLSRDTAKCTVSAATFLDSGELIIIDRSNQRIKYIDANFQYISSYDLPYRPWAVCARGGDVYVSMDNTKLQHVFVKDMIIEPERVIDITGRCLGICIVGEFIAVGLQIGEIALINTVGELQKTIQLPKLPKGSPCNPWHLSLTREQNILVTDSDAESVFCINMASEVLFTFKMFSSPRGTAVDNQGNIILAGRDNESGDVVVTLSHDFELQNILHMSDSSSERRGLLTWAELEFVPYCVAYRSDNVVVLGGIQEALKIMRIVS